MRIALARRAEALDSWIDNLASCKIRGYSGTRPTDADTALSGNTLLFECTGNATFSPSSSAGVLTANAITQDSVADNTGTLTFVRIYQSDGTTPFCDLSVGTSGAEFNIPSLSIVAGLVVQVSAMTLSLPVGA